ncbi:MAG: cell division protein ZapA [Treponema sp.]|nr:cell division protein ZapA [Treponema sp.]
MGKLHIDLLGTSFTVQANDDEQYLEKLLGYYSRIVEDVSQIPSLKNPLQASILAGIMLCDELYKEKSKVADLKEGLYYPPENNSQSNQQQSTQLDEKSQKEAEELERRTLALISKINRVL